MRWLVMAAWLDQLVAGVLLLARWIVRWLGERFPSRTGFANRRVRHVRGALGYHLHSYEVGLPNITRWLRGERELFPTVLQVQTINRCNAACAMCPYPYTIALEPREQMDDALFRKIVAECAAEPQLQDFVPMAKNEPLLDRKLAARIAEFKAAAQPHQLVELVTNGSALTPDRFQALADAGVDLLTVSLNAATPETYARVMGGLSWRQVMSNLEALAATERGQVNRFVRFVKQRDNQAEARRFARHWRRRGFNVMLYEINNRAETVQGFAGLAVAKSAITRRLRKAIGRRLFKGCPYAFSVMHILQNGDVPLCANDWQNRLVLGNVRNASIRTIFNSPQIQTIRELMRQGRYDEIEPCRNCSFRHEWL
jgi:radical SAM protein with 4Fe4S-binding SPASM domain